MSDYALHLHRQTTSSWSRYNNNLPPLCNRPLFIGRLHLNAERTDFACWRQHASFQSAPAQIPHRSRVHRWYIHRFVCQLVAALRCRAALQDVLRVPGCATWLCSCLGHQEGAHAMKRLVRLWVEVIMDQRAHFLQSMSSPEILWRGVSCVTLDMSPCSPGV